MSSIIVSSACTLTLTYNNLSFPLGLDIVIPEEAPHLSFPQRPPICHSRRGPPFVIPEGFYRESSVFAFAIAVFSVSKSPQCHPPENSHNSLNNQ